jgi:hypothetical protein
MQLYLEMLLKASAGPLTDKQKDMLQEIKNSQEKMLTILNDFKAKYDDARTAQQ